jgi:hypothetical protein
LEIPEKSTQGELQPVNYRRSAQARSFAEHRREIETEQGGSSKPGNTGAGRTFCAVLPSYGTSSDREVTACPDATLPLDIAWN